jgi:leucyl/phenylalanyl-tRNA---protein transferase
MLTWLNASMPFPPVEHALGAGSGASGLLAASRDLSFERLLSAYQQGIFPWYSDTQPVLWWSPDPRMVLDPGAFKISASLRKTLQRVLRDPDWEIRVDAGFKEVMQACADTERPGQDGTWITADIIEAYHAMHLAGYAHSVETWYCNERVGGLYGIGIGKMLYGESMFARRNDASKIALAALVGHARRHRVEMIDCQQNTPHLSSLGGREISRTAFLGHLRHAITAAPIPWGFDKSALQDALA